MRIGTQDKDFFPKGFIEKFQLIKDMGFDCYEVDGKVLLDHLEEIQEATQKTGLPVASVCGGARGWIGDFIEERRLHAVEDIKAMISALEKIGGHGIVVPAAWGMFTYRLPPMQSPRSVEGDTKAILDSLNAIHERAREKDIYIYLEPLNRYQDHMLNTLEDARKIIEAGQFTHIKILADFYHMSIEEDDLSKSLVDHVDLIKHIHIAENHRYQPGTGSLDFKKHFETLKNIKYKGDLVYECRVRGDNPMHEYEKSLKFVKSLL